MSVAVEEKKDPTAKFGSQVDEQIAQATGRIRAHDLTLGGLTLAAMVAVYATTMILVDKYLNLSESIRQISLAGFLVVLAGVGYWLIVRPLRKRINPLYAAARVEKTIDDAKNSVTGYVEAQEKGEVHAAVKAAMSAKAAKAVGEADVNRAVDHRSLLVAGGILLLCLLTLAVLFFVFRPSQFSSLFGRAVFPFSSDPIATRTQLTLLKPDPAEPTITTGQTITVAVHVGGKVPARNAPDRVRVLLRHTQADPNYEEIPMEEGETTRDWQVKVPDYLVQNGFWYKVAAGDYETPEYRVTVRTLPQFSEFEATYEYPAYMNKPTDKGTGSTLRAYRGTKVTLVAKTNREVKEGLMAFDVPGLEPVPGTPAPGKPDSLMFKFTVTEAARYKLFMTTTGGERNTDPPSFTLALDSDQRPRVTITKPEEAETTEVANGQLKVDGVVGDDFGIDKVRLRMRIDGRDLAPVPYMGGKSFRREKDNTWPTDLEYKLSADLAKLTYADGAKFEPQFAPDKPVVIEYWVEAIDNCSVAKPVEDWNKQAGNVGRSDVRRLTLTPPEMDPERKKELDNRKEQRGDEERQHNQQQERKLDKENREKKPQDGKPQAKDGTEPPAGEPEKKPDNDSAAKPDPKKNGMGGGMGNATDTLPKKEPPDPKTPTEGKPGGMSGTTDPKTPTDPKKMPPDPKMSTDPGGKPPEGMKDPGMPPPKGTTEPKMGGMGMGMTGAENANPMAPMPRTQEEKQTDENAKRVQDELDKNRGEGGDAKPNINANEKDRTDPAQSKPQQPPPQDGGTDSKPKEGPKPPTDPMNDKDAAAQSKPQGNLEKPTNPDGSTKPAPKQDPMKPQDKSAQPSESRTEPLGGNPGQDKPDAKPDPKFDPKDPKNQNRDAVSGSSGKPPTEKPEEMTGTPNDPNTKKDPTASAAEQKPNPEPNRGTDKPAQAKAGPPSDDKKDQNNAATAKPQQAPPPAGTKPPPKQDDAVAKGMSPDMTDAKPPPPESKPTDPKGTGASETKPEAVEPPLGGGVDKGIDKPDDKQPKDGKADPKTQKGAKGKGRKFDEKEKQEIRDALENLNSPDPDKRKAAQDKLDKTIGEDKRKEIEQIQKDLDSPNMATREAAKKKVEDMVKKAEEEAKKDGEGAGKKLTQEELKELTEKARDLTSPDDKKRQAAEQLFDEKLGKERRQQIQEEIKKREKEFDKDFGPKQQEDLKNKIDEIAKKDDGKDGAKGKELTPEEIADLAKKAQDLNSKDEQKRREAEKALDEKIGKDAREKLQEQMKNQPPMTPEEQDKLKKEIDEIAKNMRGAGKGPIDPKQHKGPGASLDDPKAAMEDDPRNRAKTAQLQLQEFEKHLYDKDLHEKLGWTPEQYERFVKDYEKRVKQLQEEAAAHEEALKNQPEPKPGDGKYNPGGANKVDAVGPKSKVEGSTSGAAVAPPGFDKSREDFLKAIEALKQKK
jgi:hypothetical protein